MQGPGQQSGAEPQSQSLPEPEGGTGGGGRGADAPGGGEARRICRRDRGGNSHSGSACTLPGRYLAPPTRESFFSPQSTTVEWSAARVQVFGPIEDISLHFRDRGDNYGFVTFQHRADAYTAVERGNQDSSQPRWGPQVY